MQCQSRLTEAENSLAECLSSLHAKEAENERVRLSLMEADKEIGAQQENFFQLKVQLQGEEQRIGFLEKDLSHLDRGESEAVDALSQLENKLKLLVNEIAELSMAQENYLQLSLFEETFMKEQESELAKFESQIRTYQAEIETEKSALIQAASQIAYLRNDAVAKEKRRAEIGHELSRNDGERSLAENALDRCRARLHGAGSSLDH